MTGLTENHTQHLQATGKVAAKDEEAEPDHCLRDKIFFTMEYPDYSKGARVKHKAVYLVHIMVVETYCQVTLLYLVFLV